MAPEGADPVVVLSHRTWQRRFGGASGVVGRTVMLDRRPFRIVGVMPRDFAMPGPEVELIIPWGLASDEPRDQHYVSAVARLSPGITLAQAQSELRGIAMALAGEHPDTN